MVMRDVEPALYRSRKFVPLYALVELVGLAVLLMQLTPSSPIHGAAHNASSNASSTSAASLQPFPSGLPSGYDALVAKLSVTATRLEPAAFRSGVGGPARARLELRAEG